MKVRDCLENIGGFLCLYVLSVLAELYSHVLVMMNNLCCSCVIQH